MRSSGVGARLMNRSHPSVHHAARARWSTGWTGTLSSAPVLVAFSFNPCVLKELERTSRQQGRHALDYVTDACTAALHDQGPASLLPHPALSGA
jgi:hypothetical protein